MDDRELLLRLGAGGISGDALAREAGVTRAAIWKRIQALRAAGVGIEARPGHGYALAQAPDLLDAAALRAALPATVAAAVGSLEVAWSLDSTNSELLRRPPAAATAVLLAERQTAGRGRLGRRWSSPLGAQVCLSVRRGFEGGLARLGGLSLVAGVAVAEALRAQGFPQVGLKWPNDLVVGERKLAGLLVEGGGEHAGPVQAVIGIGINVRLPEAAGATIDQPWTDLARLAGDAGVPSRTALAAAVLAALLPALDAFDRDGLAPFLPRYAALDALAGRQVRVLAGPGAIDGVAAGLAADGGLRVRAATGEERIFHAGEVSVRPQ
ncbi:bifunctional biotin--[acetyl-CoA-carboxylase] ligase/biotin operon repressor BirA [Pseudoxanthomonas daejeonensis]|uniref:Bifunctional ligase/repressor BirA n=1 Tax=Pseudoxanthomonas daejeonensis TaxID=266062 RepID=A0ABQ6ZAX7_9GAMM|nr:bifunctional biotin--[acetyl-CoA-carboxylase] ligase/biotin operon repressor BirA [Pseudoxanthomonas daejeonensis]KAF1697019.1 bifunctional biotin--[acetyl-CoA-carboxylase] synthetase/biotin operon repressor [Pseudoxanthomonas daejeonensis]UNK56369.1 bifunctional biotin--[acetyl-CoA-carboxylase] ligase/biotin operon repressor BirA [Pseudoxanthomonas daejeonensis]